MATDVIDMVTDPANTDEACHAICYGEPGCGKTSTLDDPEFLVCLIDLEGGSVPLKGSPNVKRYDIPAMTEKLRIERKKPHLTEFEVLAELVQAIKDRKLQQYHLFGMDSFTKLEDMIKHYVATVYAPNRKREIPGKFGAMADWGDLQQLMVSVVDTMHSITKRGIHSRHVMWFAHVAKEKDEITGVINNTKIMLQGSRTSEIVMSRVDAYFYMAAKDLVVDGKSAGTERAIWTKVISIFNSKARISKYLPPLPAKIVAPVWSQVFKLMGYGDLTVSDTAQK